MDNIIIIYKHFNKIIFAIGNNNIFEDKIYEYDNNLDLVGNMVSILQKYLNVSYLQNKNVFIIDKSHISFKYRYDIATIMFELLHISSFYIASQSILCLYDNDTETGTVVEIYDNKLYAVPICDNKINTIIEIKTGNIKNNNIIKSKIKKIIDKMNAEYDIENVFYSSSVTEDILENIDNYNGEIIMGDPLNGAKKIIPLLNSLKHWITKEKYKQTGKDIIQKQCFN